MNVFVVVFMLLRLCDRIPRKIDRLPKSDLLTVIPCDFNSMRSVSVEGLSADVFYHIGWSYTDKAGRKSCEKQSLNIKYTFDAIALAAHLGCSRFIGTGSQAEYGRVNTMISPDTPVNPEDAYGISKYAAGKLSRIECERRGIEHIWVRGNSVYMVVMTMKELCLVLLSKNASQTNIWL